MGLLDRLTSALNKDELPEDALAELHAGKAALLANDLDGAGRILGPLALRFSRTPAVQHAWARLALARGDREEHVLALGRIADARPRSAMAWLELGEALAGLMREQPASDAFRRVLVLAPEGSQEIARAYFGRGRLALAAGKSGRAARELLRAEALLPDEPALLHALGLALIERGELRAGSERLLRAASAAGAAPEWVLDAVRFSQGQDHDLEQIEALVRARTAQPESEGTRAAALCAAWSNRLRHAGRLAEALVEARRAIAADDSSHEARLALRQALRACGAYTDALALDATLPANALTVRERLALALEARSRPALEALAEQQAAFGGHDAEAQQLITALTAWLTAPEANNVRALADVTLDREAWRFLAAPLAPPAPPAGDMPGLLRAVQALCVRNSELSGLAPAATRACAAFDRPLRVAVVGEWNAGKSSLVNLLCGDALAPVGVTPTTATLNVLGHGRGGGRVVFHDGHTRELPARAVRPFLESLVGQDPGTVALVEHFRPIELLSRIELIDTPGLNAGRAEHDALTREALTTADALIWVFSALQAGKDSERRVLEAAHARGTPIVGVLNKLDLVAPDEQAALIDHVSRSFSDLLAALVPLSTQTASLTLDGQAVDGKAALSAVFEQVLLQRTGALKHATARRTLRALLDTARETVARAGAVEPVDAGTGGLTSEPGEPPWLAEARTTLPERARAELAQAADALLGLLPARNLAARAAARIEQAATGARVDPEAPQLALARALTLDLLLECLEGAFSPLRKIDDQPQIESALERYLAFARGALGATAAGLAEAVQAARSDGSATERDALRRIFSQALPDPEAELFVPLGRALAAQATLRAEAAARAARTQAITRLLFEVRLREPIEALSTALTTLA